jgi:peptidoglycan-N-acetylglucosamine deacetylase
MASVRIPIRERVFKNWIWRLPPGRGQISLTFDDGPHPQTTPLLLRTLDATGIVCTFFAVGSRIDNSTSDILKSFAASGHAIANHGWQHQSLQFRSAGYQRRSLRATDERIRDAVGQGSSFFRPPFGMFNRFTVPTLRALNYRGVLWSVIARDWIPRPADELWTNVVDQLHDGAIIVLHDGHTDTTPTMLDILPRLAEEVARRGWTFVPLLPSTISDSNSL